MKKVALLALLVASVAAPAMAGQIRVDGYGTWQTNNGGEFTLVNKGGFTQVDYAASVSNSIAGSFQTFCIESTSPPEYIYTNTTYDAVMNTKAINGGVGPVGDPLSQGTGWLYSQFAQGTLTGYDYANSTVGRHVSADQLQKAIWWLEGDVATYDSTNTFMLAVVTKFGTQGAAKADGTYVNGMGNYGVYAINLWEKDYAGQTGHERQDQLYYHVPDGGATLMLLGGALIGLGALRRKFNV